MTLPSFESCSWMVKSSASAASRVPPAGLGLLPELCPRVSLSAFQLSEWSRREGQSTAHRRRKRGFSSEALCTDSQKHNNPPSPFECPYFCVKAPLVNVFTAASRMFRWNLKRVIFFSFQEVFSQSYKNNLKILQFEAFWAYIVLVLWPNLLYNPFSKVKRLRHTVIKPASTKCLTELGNYLAKSQTFSSLRPRYFFLVARITTPSEY